MWLTRRLPGRLGIGLSVATVTVSPKGLPCALPAVGAINAAAAAATRHTVRFISVTPVDRRRELRPTPDRRRRCTYARVLRPTRAEEFRAICGVAETQPGARRRRVAA